MSETPQNRSCVSQEPVLHLVTHSHTQGVSVKHECQERPQQTTNTSRVGFYFTLTEETKGGREWIVNVIGRTKQTRGPSDARFPHTEGKKNLISISPTVQVFDFRPHSSAVWCCVKTQTRLLVNTDAGKWSVSQFCFVFFTTCVTWKQDL